jgi:hypothetical protein
MKLLLDFHEGIVRAGHATYRRSEFGLLCVIEREQPPPTLQTAIETSLGMREPAWYATAGRLTLTFRGPRAELVSLDAYTNAVHWITADDLTPLEIAGTGTVCLAEPLRDADRISLDVDPRFRYAPSQRRLRIEIGGMPNRYYQIGSCLVVGVDDEGLATLDVTDLQML